MNITENNGDLYVKFEHHSNLTAHLEHIGNNRFLCTYSDPTYGIKAWDFKTENKQVKSVILRVADFLEYTEYEFIKH
ncbi:MAG: hypothetical protein HC905_18255 [Bacteroidales bacterium]|nr:hypothetical protein [Bacteroidales bacterium]